jgi:hypothetical protein
LVRGVDVVMVSVDEGVGQDDISMDRELVVGGWVVVMFASFHDREDWNFYRGNGGRRQDGDGVDVDDGDGDDDQSPHVDEDGYGADLYADVDVDGDDRVSREEGHVEGDDVPTYPSKHYLEL